MAATNRTIDKIKPKRTKDEVKRILRGCNAAAAGHSSAVPNELALLWYGYANELCGNGCPGCTTPEVLRWLWPGLKEYAETMTIEEAMADPNVDDVWKNLVRGES